MFHDYDFLVGVFLVVVTFFLLVTSFLVTFSFAFAEGAFFATAFLLDAFFVGLSAAIFFAEFAFSLTELSDLLVVDVLLTYEDGT